MRSALGWAGRNGSLVVIASVVLGFAFPALSAAARPWLVASIFGFTLGALLKFDPACLQREFVQVSRNAAMVAWATFGVPLLVWGLILVVRPGPGLAQGMLFWALVPPSGACVAFAVLLGLRVPLALLATVVATAAAPFYMPWMATAMGGFELSLDPAAMSLKLLAVIGGAWIASMLLKRFASSFVRANPDAVTGVAVASLFMAGLGSMRGMLDRFNADPAQTLLLLALAYALLGGVQLLSALIFRRCGASASLTAGLISSTRTITLAWVVLGDRALPAADVFFGCVMVAKYTMPGILRPIVSRLLAAEAAGTPVPAAATPAVPVRLPAAKT